VPIKAKAFSGPTQHLTLSHPFFAYKSKLDAGVPIGIDVETKALVLFDPWWLKQCGLIHSTRGAFIADKSFGKSTALKILALRLSMLAAGYDDPRLWINDHKTEGDRMEYSRIASLTGAKEFRMASMGVNPFDSRLCPNLSNLIDMAMLLCSFAEDGTKMAPRTKLALRAAVFRMFKGNKLLWSPSVLLTIAASLNSNDVRAYVREGRDLLQREHEARMERLQALDLNEVEKAEALSQVENEFKSLLYRDMTLDFDGIAAESTNVFATLDDVFSGADAGIFGDSSSLYDMYTQHTVNRIWTGFTPRGERMMRAIDGKISIYGIENHQLDLVPHINLDDEAHKSMSNPENAAIMAYLSNIGRSVRTCHLSASPRLNDMRHGNIGSRHWEDGQTVVDGLGFLAVSRQPNNPAILAEIQERARLTNTWRDALTELPRYTFLFKLGQEVEPTVVKMFATPLELAEIQTDAASEAILRRPNLEDADDLRYYAKRNGVIFLGEEAV